MARQRVQVQPIPCIPYNSYMQRLHALWAMNHLAYVSEEDCEINSSIPNPEEAYEQKESFQHGYAELSTEAKTVLTMLLTAPSEVVDVICGPHRDSPTITRLKQFVRENFGWNYRQTSRAVKELRAYAHSL